MRNLLSAFAILLVGLSLAYLINNSKPDPDKVTEKAPVAIEVNTLIASPKAISINIKSHGIITASTQIDLLAQVTGEILTVSDNFIDGAVLSNNALLLTIDDSAYKAQLADAKLKLAQAQELYYSEKARAYQAKKEWQDRGSKEANALFLREPQLNSAKAQLTSAELGITRSEKNLAHTEVRLPFAANMIQTHVNLGQLVMPGNTIASIYQQDKLQVKLPISQRQLGLLNIRWPEEARKLHVSFSAQIGNRRVAWLGRVKTGSTTIEPNNQNVHLLVDLIIDEHSAAALPGQYIEATISGQAREGVIKVPEDAFHDKRFVLSINDGKLAYNPAYFLYRDGLELYLQSNIATDTVIIIDRIPLATNGMQVKAKEPNQ